MQPTVYVSEHKIAIPRVPDEFVPRPALRDLLDRADPRNLVVVSAPAGYGKSLLLADWAGRHRARTAWVTVDQGDNDPRHLWAAVRAAIASRFTVPGEGSGRRPVREGPNVSPLDDLLVVVEQLDEPLVLVLDDLHEITSVEVLHELARFVRSRPVPLRLVLASRVDPPFALARLRLDGRLCEVRRQQLRFTGEHAAALLAKSGCELRPDQTADLVSRTEGWAAGIRLAAVALRRAGDPDRFLAEFSGDERSVADYLTGEMMASLTEPSLDLLRSVSVCSHISGDLAVGLSGRDDARLQLDRLAHETGLIEIGSADTYRIHALLRSLSAGQPEAAQPQWTSAAARVRGALVGGPRGSRTCPPPRRAGRERRAAGRPVAQFRRVDDAAGRDGAVASRPCSDQGTGPDKRPRAGPALRLRPLSATRGRRRRRPRAGPQHLACRSGRPAVGAAREHRVGRHGVHRRAPGRAGACRGGSAT